MASSGSSKGVARVGLFVTCLVDLIRPSVGFAAVKLLEDAGCRVVTAHDIRDYDFEATPILAGGRVFGAGKAGRVLAWDRSTKQRLWETRVGTHLNDRGPLPLRRRFASAERVHAER